MIFTVTKPTQIEVSAIHIILPVNYGTEDIPQDFPRRFPRRIGDCWDVKIDLETGRILNDDWPTGEFELSMKVKDQGTYKLLGSDGKVVAKIEEDYVPHCVVPGQYGDYVELSIKDGVVMNWRKPRSLDDFFPKHE